MAQRLLIIDTETGGLDPIRHSILSLGATVWEEGHQIAEIELLIAEDEIIADDEALAINRIDTQQLKLDGLSPKDAIARLEVFILEHFNDNDQVSIAGHNVGFDVGFLKRLYRLAGRSYKKRFSHRLLDTASIMGFLRIAGMLPIENSGLEAGLKYFGVEVHKEVRHSALGDAKATAALLSAMIELVQRRA